jgi:Asp-tRNA(Asn)/Glu-tRNA(Gln) amidotransferase A subunit family amidase
MINRRRFFAVCSASGLAGTLVPEVLWALAQSKDKITAGMIDQAAALADVPIPGDVRDMMLANLETQREGYEEIYQLHMPNSAVPALAFEPVLPGMKFETAKRPMRISDAPAVASSGVPKNLEDLAFDSVRQIAELVRSRKVSSVALTEMYLERLKRHDKTLHFVITLTEDRALAQAKEADRDIAAGKYRGALHGIPWGAKDLLAVKGYPTTWGAGGFEHQMFDEDATVVKRLDDAGAVLIAKLTTGALALGDHWYGGVTRNPWNAAQGSSGSSAGPASATAAGCVGFSIGSETLGSISSPSTRCGCTGLRPTYGLVPRTGAMTVSWSMDKLGPICRAVEDCAMVLDAIHGPDGHEGMEPHAFNWDAKLDWRKLRIGYLKTEFESLEESQYALPRILRSLNPEQGERARGFAQYDRRFLEATLARLKEMGVKLIPVEIPKYPYDAMVTILFAEAAAAFDELTRSGRDKLLTGQTDHDWPNFYRAARFVPAVEYIQANRARRLAIQGIAKAFEGVDVVITPTYSTQLVATNLSGHPALILPNGFREVDAPPPTTTPQGEVVSDYGGAGTPVSLTFLGQLYGEAKLLAFARAYQEATGFHLHHPKLHG